MPNKKINQLDTRVGAALTDLILIGDPTSGTSFKLTATDFKTLLNNVPYTGATTNVNLGAFNLTAASIIRTGGTSSQFLKADGSVDSSTYTPTSRTLTINGTSFDLSADRSWTIAAGITGSGTSGQVAYWNGTSSQTGSNNLFWDAANSGLVVGNNVLSSFFRLGVNGNIVVSGTSPYITFNTATNSGSTPAYIQFTNATSKFDIVSTGAIEFFSNANARMRLFGTGNLGINTGATDSGQRLQVMGDALVRGSGDTSATTGLTIQNSSSQNLLRIRNDGRYTIGNNASAPWIHAASNGNPNNAGGNLYFYNFVNAQNSGVYTFGGDASSITTGFTSGINLDYNFSTTSGTGVFNAFHITSRVNQQFGANGVSRGIFIAPTLTSAADWRSIEWSNNSGWGLYGAGTANNYLGGNTTISRNQNATTSLTISNTTAGASSYTELILQQDASAGLGAVGKMSSISNPAGIITSSNTYLYNGTAGDIAIYNAFASGRIRFSAGAVTTAQMTLTAAGRLLLGTTTESTFLLDVNGTARVSGAMTISGLITAQSGLFVNGILDIYNDGSNGAIAMRTLTNTLCLRKYVKVLGDDGGFGNNNASAAFQIDGTNRGFLPPRLTTTQKNAIGTPAAGLQVYDTTLNQMSYYNGTTWVNF